MYDVSKLTPEAIREMVDTLRFLNKYGDDINYSYKFHIRRALRRVDAELGVKPRASSDNHNKIAAE